MISSERMHRPPFIVPPLPRPLLFRAARVLLIHATCTVVCCETMSLVLVLNLTFDYEPLRDLDSRTCPFYAVFYTL
jgi:hypothetical protein